MRAQVFCFEKSYSVVYHLLNTSRFPKKKKYDNFVTLKCRFFSQDFGKIQLLIRFIRSKKSVFRLRQLIIGII